YVAGRIRRGSPGENHFAADGDRAAGRRSSGREQGLERRRAHLRRRVYRDSGQPALPAHRPRSPLNRVATPRKMNPTIALSAIGRNRGGEPSPSRNRFAEFLSSATRRRAKPKRDAMEQPRPDEDQQLVARTQTGQAAAYDERV